MGNVGRNLAHQLAAGQYQGMILLYRAVQRQAMMLSFNDIYRVLCVMMLVLIPTFVFLQRDLRNAPAGAH
jgi:hypothetical protein